MLDLYCTIYLNSHYTSDHLKHLLVNSFLGKISNRTVTTQYFEISIMRNKFFDSNRLNDFICYPHRIEIDSPDSDGDGGGYENISETEYISSIGKILQFFWSLNMDAVAACDYEDLLPKRANS